MTRRENGIFSSSFPGKILNDTDAKVKMIFDKTLADLPCIGVHPNINTIWIAYRAIKTIVEQHGNIVRGI